MEPASLCCLLPWDSEFFDRSIARCNASRLDTTTAPRVLDWCRERKVDCLYFLADVDDAATTLAAEEHGFQLVDLRLTLSQQVGNHPSRSPRVINQPAVADVASAIRPFRANDVPRLAAIARCCHNDSRFYFDPNFPKERCDQLYQTWIERSCTGFADAIFVAEFEGIPSGYITCRKTETAVGEISLLGVDSRARGHGIGQALVRTAGAWFEENGMHKIRVTTQGRNVQAQRLYQKNGYTTEMINLWYHRWFSGRGSHASER